MKVIVQSTYDFVTTNGTLFHTLESDIGAGLMRPWNELYAAAKERGIDMFTPDQCDEGDLLILMDRPSAIKAKAPRIFAVMFEPDLIIPNNYHDDFIGMCEKVFTWDDRLVDGKKFIKSNFTTNLQDSVLFNFDKPLSEYYNRKLLCLMNTHKRSSHPNSLYERRIEAIEFFTRYAPNDFDLWGRFWGMYNFPTYRGSTDDKLKTLSNYRFCITYENCNNAHGYVSEKMTDCFMVGVVPIYWGAPNVYDHVPPECFVDLKKFQSYEELHRYLHEMPSSEYETYLAAAREFLASPQSEQFYNKYFVDTILKHMVNV